jgi:hypothetical protein
MKNILFFILCLLFSLNDLIAQNYLLQNEVLIFSFETQKGKKMVLAKDKNNEYIIYRFGTLKKIEFEFPDKTIDSWNKFTYSFYLRGGGIENDGLDLNYINFRNNEYNYEIYETYYSVENETNYGIEVTNLTNNKIVYIKGDKNKIKGTLMDFRNNNLIKKDVEIDD